MVSCVGCVVIMSWWLVVSVVLWWCSDGQLCRLCCDDAVMVSCVGSEFSHNAQKLSPELDSVARRHLDCTWQSDLTHVVECSMSRHTMRLHHTTCRTVHCGSHHMSTTYCASHVTLHLSHLTWRSSGCYCSFVVWVQVLISNRIFWRRSFKTFPGVSDKRHWFNSRWLKTASFHLPLQLQGADKSLARPGRKQATATEDFEFHISYL